MSDTLKEQIFRLEAEYDRLYDKIENHGGVDYQGRLPVLRKKIEAKRREAQLWSNMHKATESDNTAAAKSMVDILLDEDADDTIAEIAADFIENEVGRFDWLRNWETLKKKENVVNKVNRYLNGYGIAADAQQVVNQIDWMVQNNPGRWK